jgi:hypothetical protein
MTTPPTQVLQRLERSGESAKGILLHRMEQKAEWAGSPATAGLGS